MRRRPDYQMEPIELADSIWDAKVITPLQLHRIVAWKSAQGLAWVTLNSEKEIQLRSMECMDAIADWREADVVGAGTEWERWESSVRLATGSKQPPRGLLGLRGVRYPVASAVLSILAPKAFPVIDRWGTKAIYGREINSFRSVSFYRHYAQQLVAVRDLYPDCNTIHEIDVAVMNAARDCRHDARPCACMPFEAVAVPEDKGTNR